MKVCLQTVSKWRNALPSAVWLGCWTNPTLARRKSPDVEKVLTFTLESKPKDATMAGLERRVSEEMAARIDSLHESSGLA
jgi:hypothetical protein